MLTHGRQELVQVRQLLVYLLILLFLVVDGSFDLLILLLCLILLGLDLNGTNEERTV